MGTSPFKRRLRNNLRAKLWKLGQAIAPKLLGLLQRQSRETLQGIARGFGTLWFHLIPSSRKLGMDNLDLVCGGTLSRERKAFFCKQSFINILSCMMDYFYFSFRTDEGRALVSIDPVSEDRLKGLLEKGRGALFFSAHLGNWELLAAYMSKYAPPALLTRKQKEFDHYMVEFRQRYGVNTLFDHATLPREIIARLRQGELVGFALDRNLRNTKGIMTDFLGKPAYTPYFPILLALKSKAPLVGTFLVKEGDGYRLYIEEPIEAKPLGSREETYRHYTQAVSDVIGKYVMQHPGQWFWAHKRWGKPKGRIAF